MGFLKRLLSFTGAARFVSLLGGFVIALAVARIVIWEGGGDLTDVVVTDLLLILPGIVLIYGGYWLPTTDLNPDVYPRIVTRTLAGVGVMLGVVGALAISTGLNRPVFTPLVAIALGSVGGFVIGLNEARAVSRAHEAEHHLDELRQERDLRDQILGTSPIGIVVVDPDGSIRMANKHAARITGLTEEELEALDQYNDPIFEAADADGNRIKNERLMQEIQQAGEARYNVERRITTPEGERIWLSVNGAPLSDRSGDGTAVIIVFEDITERKRLEQDLNETIDSLEESNERLQQFAYAASHDLQEPLRMVSSYLQLLEDRYADELDADAEEFIEFAVGGADRMRTMIESLLEYSRVSQGNPLEPTDANAVLDDVLADLQLRIEETDATITTDDLPTVAADSDQLAQVFQNLISNAITYCGEEQPRIHVGVDHTADVWRFSVADEGIGIDPEHQTQIFKVFEQLHARGDDPETKGGGIGLALCERIVERHGGEIWVESEQEGGSTFYFTIPVTEDQDSEYSNDPSHSRKEAL